MQQGEYIILSGKISLDEPSPVEVFRKMFYDWWERFIIAEVVFPPWDSFVFHFLVVPIVARVRLCPEILYHSEESFKTAKSSGVITETADTVHWSSITGINDCHILHYS